MEHPEMRSDAELLNELFNEAAPVLEHRTGRPCVISRKLFTHWTGLAIQTISDYCTGKINIPVDFWRRILEHHYDRRIVGLLLPSEYDFEITPTAPLSTDPAEFFRSAVSEAGALHRKLVLVTDMLLDEVVDESDAKTVQAYLDAYAHHRSISYRLRNEIIRAYNQAVAAKQEASRG